MSSSSGPLSKERFFLADGLKKLGLRLEPASLDNLLLYYEKLQQNNQLMNLTALTKDKEILTFLFLDSLAALPFIEKLPITTVLDVGTGGGFPGLPLKIAKPSYHLTLLDSSKKKLGFCHMTSLSLGLSQVSILEGRAEALGQDKKHKGAFDLVCAKALASLPKLFELCLPFVKEGGYFLAYKSKGYISELEEGQAILSEQKGRVSAVKEVILPGHSEPHYLLLVEKVGISGNNSQHA